MTNLVIAMLVFVGLHVFVAGTGLRGVLVRAIGENAYRGMFSVLALGGLIWVAMAYRAAPMAPVWDPPSVLRWITLLFVAFGIWMIVASIRSRNPASGHEDRLTAPDAVRGVVALTRHPFMWGVVLWSIGHLLARGDQAAMVLFGGFGVLAILGSLSQDRKLRAKHGQDWDGFAGRTSFVPGLALFAGRATFRLSDVGWRSPLVALILFVILVAAHPWLFSASPLPS